MTALPAPGVVGETDPSHTKALLAGELEDIRDWLVESVIGSSVVVELTLASNTLTLPDGATGGGCIFAVETEGAAGSDTLATIALTNTHDGQVIFLMAANASHVVTIDHAHGGTGQVSTWDGQDFVWASTNAVLAFRRAGNEWIELPLRFVPPEDLTALTVSDDAADLLRVWDDSANTEKRIPALQVGRVLQVVHATDAGSSHSNTSYSNLNGGVKSITPKSASSKILIEITGAFRVGNVSAVNAAATLSIYESTAGTALSAEYTLEAFSAAGGLGAAAPGVIRVRINSSGTSLRSFGLQGKVNNGSSVVGATNMVWTITEYLE